MQLQGSAVFQFDSLTGGELITFREEEKETSGTQTQPQRGCR